MENLNLQTILLLLIVAVFFLLFRNLLKKLSILFNQLDRIEDIQNQNEKILQELNEIKKQLDK